MGTDCHPPDMHWNDRGDAVWLAANWNSVQDDLAPTIGHPTTIRKAYRKLTAPPKVEKPKAVKMVEKWAYVTDRLSPTLVHPQRVMAEG